MDSRNNFLSDLKNWIDGIDDDFLVGISNKGIFNRAKRELEEKSEVSVNINDQKVTCTLQDGTVCSFTTDIQKFKCSCPSRSICKHVIISLIYIGENKSTLLGGGADAAHGAVGTDSGNTQGLSESYASENGVAKEKIYINKAIEHQSLNTANKDTQNCDSCNAIIHTDIQKTGSKQEEIEQLLSITPSELIKLGGDRAYREALFRIDFGLDYDINKGTMLSVKFNNEGISVRFPRFEPIRDAICTCKSAEFCRHKVEAVILYQIYKNKNDLFGFKEGFNIEKPIEIVSVIKKFVSELITSGLSRLPESSAETIEQMAVICHCSNLTVLEKLFRKLKNETELYFRKSASFSRQKMLNIIVTIYNVCLAIENTENDCSYLKELIGEHKSSYYDIPPIELYGMGAESWVADSGYEGITFYFYYEKEKKWFTYTNARPVYYDDIKVNTSRMYKAGAPWGLGINLEEFSKSCIKLNNGKANMENRLSSSENCKAEITGRTNVKKIDLKEYTFSSWSELLNKLEPDFAYSLLEKKENSTLVLLKVHQWGKGAFDNITQSFSLPLFDMQGKSIEIYLKYSEHNKLLIEKLEYMERTEDLPFLLLGSIYVNQQRFCVNPITTWFTDGRMMNLTLD